MSDKKTKLFCPDSLAQKTLQNVVAIGEHLLAVKEMLSHGQFNPWLKREFGWTVRTAQRFMAVAQHFGKDDIMSFLPIDLTAAYRLVGPRVPEEARIEAISLGRTGVRVTPNIASEILGKYSDGNNSNDESHEDPTDALLLSVASVVERAGKKWPQSRIDELVEFMERLTKELKGNRK